MRKALAILVCGATLTLAGGAIAGGRARVHVLALPREVVAGQAFQVAFLVQPEVFVRARSVEPVVTAVCEGRTVTAAVVTARGKNRFNATLTLPQAGEWTIRVESSFCETVMKPSRVRVLAS